MDSGKSRSKGKGSRAKGPISANQNSAQDYISDRTACAPCRSDSHLVLTCGSSGSGSPPSTGCVPKDPESTIRNSAQKHNADGTACGPCGSSSHSVSSSGSERGSSGFPLQSAWGSGKLNFSVGGHSTVVPTEGNSTSGAPSAALGSRERESMGVQENPDVVRESKGIAGSAIQGVEKSSGKSATERGPSGFLPQSAWGSGKLNFSIGRHSIVVPMEGNSASGAPSTASGSRERESMEVQENPHVVRESKGTAGAAIQGIEGSSGKSADEPTGSVILQPSRLNDKQKQRVEGSTPVVSNKGLSTSSDYQGYKGNIEEGFDRSRGGRGGSRGGYGHQRGEYDRRPGNEGGWNRSRGRGGRGDYGSQRGGSDQIDALGRLLSSVLRHRAVELKLNIRSDGYVAVEELLKLNVKTNARVSLKSHSIDDIKEAVKRDNKQRFGLLEEKSVLLIRANQGHSINFVDSEGLLKPILSAEEVPVCVHGTYLKNLESIKKNGLNRMRRNHVHFARGLSKDSGVISGMRSDCEVFIYLDAKKALQGGMKLFLSENGVVLTEGFNGVVPPEYFANIETVERKRNKKY